MKRRIPLLFLNLLFVFNISAQAPCLPSPGGVPAGNEAPGCTLCSPVYQGSTNGYTASAPGSSGFPCGTIENNQFISVKADGSGVLSLTLIATNCTNNQGIEVIIFDQTFTPVTTCFSSNGNNFPGNIIATGLIPGEIYWIMIDGFSGDICDFILTVSGGANFTPPSPPGAITPSIDTTICPNMIISYSIAPVSGATFYDWVIPDNGRIMSGGGDNDLYVEVQYNASGGGVIKVTPNNFCHIGIPAIYPVTVLPNFPILHTPEVLCLHEFPIIRDRITFNAPGIYTFNHTTALGCDSIYHYSFITPPKIPELIDTTICAGDFFILGDQKFDEGGEYEIILSKADINGCDSTIRLILLVADNTSTILPPDELDCIPGSELTIQAVNAPPQAQFIWTSDSTGNILSGATSPNPVVKEPGEYFLEIIADAGAQFCSFFDTVSVIRRKEPLAPIFDTITDFRCNLDPVLFVLDTIFDSDSLLWTFSGVETFKTELLDSFVYYPTARYDTLLLQGQNVCGLGEVLDTLLSVKPGILPMINLFTDEICMGDSVFLNTLPTPPGIVLKWQVSGGDLFFTQQPDTFGITWDTPGVKPIRLNTTIDTCSSSPVFDTVTVFQPYSGLDIRCQSTMNEINFSWNNLLGSNLYLPVSLSGQAGIQVGNSFTVSGLAPNEQVDMQVEVSGDNPCGKVNFPKTCFAENCPNVILSPNTPSSICLDNTSPVSFFPIASGGSGTGVFEWSGMGISPSGTFDPAFAGPGNHTLNLKYSEGNCEYYSAVLIDIFLTPSANFTVNSQVCGNEPAQILYTGTGSASADFDWNFSSAANINIITPFEYEVTYDAPGFYSVNLSVEENGCISTPVNKIIEVQKPLEPIINSCSFSTNEVIFDWQDMPDASGFSINSPSGHTGVLNGSSFTVSNLSPAEEVIIEIIARSSNSCPDVVLTQSCTSLNCQPVDVSIQPIADICLNSANQVLTLQARRNGIFRPGNYLWAGPGVSPGGIFNPLIAGLGTHQIMVTLTEGPCVYSAQIDINIFDTPTSDFTSPAVICESESALITYSGSASTGADFLWNFGNANILNGSLSGPYEISFAQSGIKDVQLTVIENGCASLPFSQSIDVDPQLDNPQVSCLTSTSEITFEWKDVTDATDYEIIPLSAHSGNQNGNAYSVLGLSPNEKVEITVRAIGNTLCGPSETTLECTAKDCPPIILDVVPLPQPICEGEVFETQLIANTLGGTGNGIFSWNGPGTSPQGHFTTAGLSAGFYTVQLDYEEDNCRYSEVISFEISVNPQLSANILSPIWYPGTEGSIDLSVQNGLPPYSFSWDNSQTSEDLLSVSPGDHCVTVSNSRGCQNQECFSIGSGIFRTSPLHIICSGEGKSLSIRPPRGNFNWSPNTGLSCTDCPSPFATPTSSTFYKAIATLPDSRMDSTTVIVIVLPKIFCSFFNKNSQIDLAYRNIFERLGEINFENVNQASIEKIESEIIEKITENSIKLLPNPTSDKVIVSSISKVKKIEAFDLSGRKILESNHPEVDFSPFAKGIYFLKIETESETWMKRVISL